MGIERTKVYCALAVLGISGILVVIGCRVPPSWEGATREICQVPTALAAAPAVADAGDDGSASGFELSVVGSLPKLHGVSDIAAASVGGPFWVIEEREDAGTSRTIWTYTVDDAGISPGKPISVKLDKSLDTESLAVFADGTFVIGTETADSGGGTENIYRFTGDGNPAKPPSWSYKYPKTLTSAGNQGIEGLCVIGNQTFVTIERRENGSMQDFAPAAILDDAGKQHDGHFRLTTTDGLITGVACRPTGTPGGFEIVAIESHGKDRKSYLLHATLKVDDQSEFVLIPDQVIDLRASYKHPPDGGDPSPNLEGVTWLDQDSWLLVNDDSQGTPGSNFYRLRRVTTASHDGGAAKNGGTPEP